MYPELEMFAPFSPEENGIRGYPQGYGIRENALTEAGVLRYAISEKTVKAYDEVYLYPTSSYPVWTVGAAELEVGNMEAVEYA